MPSIHANTHLQMFTTFKEQKKKGDSMPFDIKPQTGDQTKTEAKHSIHCLFFYPLILFFQTTFFFHVLFSDSWANENNSRTIVTRGKVWFPPRHKSFVQLERCINVSLQTQPRSKWMFCEMSSITYPITGIIVSLKNSQTQKSFTEKDHSRIIFIITCRETFKQVVQSLF